MTDLTDERLAAMEREASDFIEFWTVLFERMRTALQQKEPST